VTFVFKIRKNSRILQEKLVKIRVGTFLVPEVFEFIPRL